MFVLYVFFFFFKQKTAYEITYGDWSSDVCSSDLDAESETNRMSIAGLKRTMRAVLAEHRHRPKAAQQRTDPPRPFTLDDIPTFKDRKIAARECAHCHYANN